MDWETSRLLQEIVRREGRSVLMYVGDAFPWTTANDKVSLDQLPDLIQAEARAIYAIAELLQRSRVPITSHGSYPANFTTINFVALKSILPRLANFERESIPVLESDIARFTDSEAKATT